MRLGGRPTQRGAPHDRDQRPGRAEEGGELPFGYDARGWLDAQAVKVSQVKLMQRTVKPPPGTGRPLTDQLVSRAVAARVYESTRR
jgi:hypothetical protein